MIELIVKKQKIKTIEIKQGKLYTVGDILGIEGDFVVEVEGVKESENNND